MALISPVEVRVHTFNIMANLSTCWLYSQDTINQITMLEATIARARSLRAKFGLGKGEKGEDTEDLELYISCLIDLFYILLSNAQF